MLAVLVAGGSSHALELLAAPEAVRSGSDPIQIDLAGVEEDVSLYVLLDGQDVTGFGAIEGEILTLTLGVPLANGVHEISLLRQLPDGELTVEGTWNIEVQQYEGFQSAGLGLHVTQNLWIRVAEADTPNLPYRATGDGSAELRGVVESEGVRLSGQAPFMWDTVDENFAGDDATVGDWSIEASTGQADLRVGHQEPATSTLAMDAFNRRGLSLSLRSQRLRSELTGFSVRGTPLVGLREGLGIHDASNLVSGVQLHTQLAESEKLEFALTGVWLTGESPDGGGVLSGTVGDESVMHGSSWAVQGFGSLFGRRLQASGGFSQTWADFGGPEYKDDAWSVQAVLAPFPNLRVREFPLLWTVTGDASEIGTNFASLGNPSLLPDRFTGALRSDTSWAGFALTAFAGRIEDNVNDADEIPRARADAWSLELSFSPVELLGGQRRGWLRWLGMPTLWGNYRYDRLKPVSIPASFEDLDLLANTRTDSGSGTLMFQYDRWSWSIGYSIIDTDDRALQGMSSVVQTTEIRADGTVREVAIGAGVQLMRTDLSGAPDLSHILGTFNLSTPLLTDRLRFTGDVTVDRSWDSADTEDRIGLTANGAIDWTLIQAVQSHPGLSLSLVCSYQGLRDDVVRGVDQDAYQLYLRATLTWPVILGSL